MRTRGAAPAVRIAEETAMGRRIGALRWVRAAQSTLATTTVLVAVAGPGCATQQRTAAAADDREVVRRAFERWTAGEGGPFELLADDAEWTIAGSSPMSRTYRGKEQFLEEVIRPFNARLSEPLVPAVRRIYSDGDTVVVLFDAAATARDGLPYRNTYAWFLRMRASRIVEAIAFLDTRLFDEFWRRVPPTP